jgi:hypothetical protein
MVSEVAPASAFKRSEKRWKRASAEEVYRDASLINARALGASLPAEGSPCVRRAGTWAAGQPILAFDGEDAARHGGFFVIPGALDAAQQLRLARSCLYVCGWLSVPGRGLSAEQS